MIDGTSLIGPALRAVLDTYGFDWETFARHRDKLRAGGDPFSANRLRTAVLPPHARDLVPLPARGTEERELLTRAGLARIARGELAVVVLAGGMATRFGGVVKACVDLRPGLRLLDLKVRDLERLASQCGCTIRLLLMTSFATDALLQEAARAVSSRRVHVSTFPQFVSLRLTREGELLMQHGQPSPYATGHGDFGPALQRAGVLTRLHTQGVRYVAVSNVDNVAATLDPALLALHAAAPCQMSFEVVARHVEDQGGSPARVEGVLQVIEALREPHDFDRTSIPWFSTNCLYFDLDALQAEYPLDWFAVEKRVEGEATIQYERLVNQLSAFLPCQGLMVARDGDEGRFFPIKEPADLQRDAALLDALLRARGLIS